MRQQEENSYARSGVLAGITAVLAFTGIHHLFISNIWSMLVIMLVAGAGCGWCVGWSYGLLVQSPSLGSWLRYNLLYDFLFLLLGVVSVLVFEPVMPMAALVAANAPPDDLIRQAMPMTVLFTVAAAMLVSWLYRQGGIRFDAVLLTCTLLVLLLGLNISTLGLVDIPQGSFYLLVEFYGLILAINGIYAAAFVLLEWKQLVQPHIGNGQVPVEIS